MSKEIDLNEDIIMQIEMASYMKYNDTIASMNDHLGEMYSYSDIKDTEEAQLKYEKDLAYKSIVQLQYQLKQKENIIKEAKKYLPELRKSPSYELDDKIDELAMILDKENKEVN